uniref:Calcineurin-like phosphoesterase domain-containing protein n=1 Tax=Alexandrium monilatum TaxID=311494 RepID=A0A7S4T5U0_9DINO
MFAGSDPESARLLGKVRDRYGEGFEKEMQQMWKTALHGADRVKLRHFLQRAEESPQAPDCLKHKEDEEHHLFEFLCKLVLYAPEEWFKAVSSMDCPETAKNDFKVMGVAFDASSRLRRAGIDFFHWRLTDHFHKTCEKLVGFPKTGYVLYVGSKVGGSVDVHTISNLPKKPAGAVRCVAVSDTHLLHESLVLPEGDILCHAGDLSYEESRSPDAARFEEYVKPYHDGGTRVDGKKLGQWLKEEKLEVAKALTWLGKVGHFDHRILIGGNHDYILDAVGDEAAESLCRAFGVTYLYTTRAPLKLKGLSFWGSGISFAAGYSSNRAVLSGNHAFQLDEGEEADEWARSVEMRVRPGKVDVMLTHSPVEGLLGKAGKGSSAIMRVLHHLQPKLFICGHAHHPSDPLKHTWKELGECVGVNAACLGVWNQLHGLPVVVDLPVPVASSGFSDMLERLCPSCVPFSHAA